MGVDDSLEYSLKMLLAYKEIDLGLQELLRIRSVYKSEILRKYLVEEESSEGGIYHSRDSLSLCIYGTPAHMDLAVKSDISVLVSEYSLV